MSNGLGGVVAGEASLPVRGEAYAVSNAIAGDESGAILERCLPASSQSIDGTDVTAVSPRRREDSPSLLGDRRTRELASQNRPFLRLG